MTPGRPTIVFDIPSPTACIATAIICLLSFHTIESRPTWLIKPGEPVWRIE